jgi:hypothetical protein
MSKWQIIKEYINNNEYFTRKSIKKDIGINLDQYVLLIKHSGFIEKLDIASYKRNYKIPDYITTTLLNKMAYNDNFRDKIIKRISRKEKICEIKKRFN